MNARSVRVVRIGTHGWDVICSECGLVTGFVQSNGWAQGLGMRHARWHGWR